MGLSDPVASAVDGAIGIIESLIAKAAEDRELEVVA